MGLFNRRKQAEADHLHRRKHFRMPVSLHATLYGPNDPQCIRAKPCHINELSVAGATLQSKNLYGTRCTLYLRLELPTSARPLMIPCRVVNSTPVRYYYRYGMEFIDEESWPVNKVLEYIFQVQKDRGVLEDDMWK